MLIHLSTPLFAFMIGEEKIIFTFVGSSYYGLAYGFIFIPHGSTAPIGPGPFHPTRLHDYTQTGSGAHTANHSMSTAAFSKG